jgi:hypothetical protein
MENNKLYKLSPSSFSFLYEGCKRCFYLDVIYGIRQPSMPLPGVFTIIAGLLKRHYDGKENKDLHDSLPGGIVSYGEKFVKSKIIELPNHKSRCFISGRFDIVTKFKDDTYGVIDFKTGSPKDEYSNLYSRQLHAYAYALENPEPGALNLSPVSKLGLLYFPPIKTRQEDIRRLLYEADIHWVEIQRNDQSFLKFIDEVLTILESDKLPKPDPDCLWCNYLNRVKNL